MVDETERALIGRVIAGDPKAEEEFFKLFKPRLLRASMYFLGGQDSEAEDIVQETFIIAIPKLELYVFKAPIFAWLRQISLRLCYARLRSRKRTMTSLEADLEVFMRRLAVERLQDHDAELQNLHKLEILDELKKLLKPASAEIIELRNVRGMTYAEIGQALNVPLGTVMSRLARARDQLRVILKETSEKDRVKELGP